MADAGSNSNSAAKKTLADLNQFNAVRAGWLQKANPKGKSWKRRYCVLESSPPVLRYYSEPSSASPLGKVTLNDRFVETYVAKKQAFAFRLIDSTNPSNRVYHFATGSEADLAAWVTAIQMVMDNIPAEMAHHTSFSDNDLGGRRRSTGRRKRMARSAAKPSWYSSIRLPGRRKSSASEASVRAAMSSDAGSSEIPAPYSPRGGPRTPGASSGDGTRTPEISGASARGTLVRRKSFVEQVRSRASTPTSGAGQNWLEESVDAKAVSNALERAYDLSVTGFGGGPVAYVVEPGGDLIFSEHVFAMEQALALQIPQAITELTLRTAVNGEWFYFRDDQDLGPQLNHLFAFFTKQRSGPDPDAPLEVEVCVNPYRAAQARIAEMGAAHTEDELIGLKQTVYLLKNEFDDSSFAEAFIDGGGLTELLRVIRGSEGSNTQAYALDALKTVIGYVSGIKKLLRSPDLVKHLFPLLSVPSPRVNRSAGELLLVLCEYDDNGLGLIHAAANASAAAARELPYESLPRLLGGGDFDTKLNVLALCNSLLNQAQSKLTIKGQLLELWGAVGLYDVLRSQDATDEDFRAQLFLFEELAGVPIQPLSIRLSSQLALLQETNRILSIELQEKILEVEALREGGAVAGDGTAAAAADRLLAEGGRRKTGMELLEAVVESETRKGSEAGADSGTAPQATGGAVEVGGSDGASTSTGGGGPPPPPPPMPGGGPGGPPPPPPPPGMAKKKEPRRPALGHGIKTKPLFWKRIQLPPDEETHTIWDRVRDPPVDVTQLARAFRAKGTTQKGNEIKAIEAKFVSALAFQRQTNVSVVRSKLCGMSDLVGALDSFDSSLLPADKAASLLSILPQAQEIEDINRAMAAAKGDIPLAAADQFLLDLWEIPMLAPRLQAWIFAVEFDERYVGLMTPMTLLRKAFGDVMHSDHLVNALGVVLTLGNILNDANKARGRADGFELEVLPNMRVQDSDGAVLLDHVAAQCSKFYPELQNVTGAHAHLIEAVDLRLELKAYYAEVSALVTAFKGAEGVAESLVAAIEATSGPEGRRLAAADMYRISLESRLGMIRTKLNTLSELSVELRAAEQDLLAYLAIPEKKRPKTSANDIFGRLVTFARDLEATWEAGAKLLDGFDAGSGRGRSGTALHDVSDAPAAHGAKIGKTLDPVGEFAQRARKRRVDSIALTEDQGRAIDALLTGGGW